MQAVGTTQTVTEIKEINNNGMRMQKKINIRKEQYNQQIQGTC